MRRPSHARAAAWRLLLALGPLLCPPAWPEPRLSRAVIVNPSDAGRCELARVVRAALGAPVTLADDALTSSSMLIIEPADPRDDSGRPLNGRRLDRPETFELFTRRSRCVLVQMRTGRRWTLRHAACRSIASQ
jgi:hypothetical protein